MTACGSVKNGFMWKHDRTKAFGESRMEKKDLKSMTLEELTEFVKELGEKPFRAKQLYQWMHVKLAESLDECTNLPKSLKEKLSEYSTYTSLKTVKMLESGIDGTRKYLFGLDDGNVIESVLMKYHHGNSVCISSQVGCRMGCRFCASTWTDSQETYVLRRCWIRSTGSRDPRESGSPTWWSWEVVSRWITMIT